MSEPAKPKLNSSVVTTPSDAVFQSPSLLLNKGTSTLTDETMTFIGLDENPDESEFLESALSLTFSRNMPDPQTIDVGLFAQQLQSALQRSSPLSTIELPNTLSTLALWLQGQARESSTFFDEMYTGSYAWLGLVIPPSHTPPREGTPNPPPESR